MGACVSSDGARNTNDGMDFQDAGQVEKSRAIDKDLRAYEKTLSKEVKILLLGAGESGKTTVLKQMRLIHTPGFTDAERDLFKAIVFANLLTSMRTMLEAMETLAIPLENVANDRHLDLLILDKEISAGEPFPLEFLAAFRDMWKDEGVRTAARRGNEYALQDNVFYFFNDLERLFVSSYSPTDQDILHCRLKTTGISETIFALKDVTYRMFDVGGQRSERKKWIHCFENVTAILFLVSISGYDKCLEEDTDANQMSEALMLFDTICNSQWFSKTSIILFLNKIDLFKLKLPRSSVSNYFPEYTGCDELEAMTFFQQQFVRLNRSETKDVYTHFTNATDTTLLRRVMLSVTDIILQKNLQHLIL